MLVELVQVMTRDGVRLDGSLQTSPAGIPRDVSVDAVLLIHGTGGNFYSSTLFDSLAERFLELGSAVLRVNTRGHDLISTATTSQGGRRLGAAYEVVDDCRHDLAAWVDWLGTRKLARVGLIGHSLGAVKAIYSLAQESHPSVVCLVALSPPRLSYSHFSASPQGSEFLETYAAAEQHVQAGHANTLMEVKIPLPFVVTAGGYVEKYGPDERYNFLTYVARVSCPSLLTYGSIELETNMAFHGLPELLQPIALESGRMRVKTIAGADHFYTGARTEVVSQAESWLRSH